MTSFTTLNENAASVRRVPHCPGFHRSGPTLHHGTQAGYPGAPWVGFPDVLGSCAEPGDLFGGAGIDIITENRCAWRSGFESVTSCLAHTSLTVSPTQLMVGEYREQGFVGTAV